MKFGNDDDRLSSHRMKFQVIWAKHILFAFVKITDSAPF
jgi:hypothetical protein